MPITFKRSGWEAITLEALSFKGVALDKVTFKKANQEAVTVFESKPQLPAPQNVTADGTVVSWDEVENATEYEVYADGASIGTVKNSETCDLTTLSGWAGLSSGAHSIQLKAKAAGYKDSELSQAVSVTKVYIIQPGHYKWVDKPVLPGRNDGGGSQPIKFSSNNRSCTSLSIAFDSSSGYSRIRYRFTDIDDWVEVYKTNWVNTNYKTITVLESFTTTAQEWYYYTFGGSGNLVKQTD